MKSFTIAIILFTILIAGTITNSIFIKTSIEELSSSAKNIPSIKSKDCLIKLNEFNEDWNKFKKIATLTVSYSELNKISCLIDELYTHFYNMNNDDFEHARTITINALREVSRLEQFNTISIF